MSFPSIVFRFGRGLMASHGASLTERTLALRRPTHFVRERDSKQRSQVLLERGYCADPWAHHVDMVPTSLDLGGCSSDTSATGTCDQWAHRVRGGAIGTGCWSADWCTRIPSGYPNKRGHSFYR